MSERPLSPESLRFGRIEIAPRERQLRIDGIPATVGARAFDLLMALIERRDRLVTKSELLDLVWPGLVVEENNLQVQISTLRKVLGPRTISTIPGRGYRFSAALDGERGGMDSAAVVQAAPAAARRTNLPAELPMLYGRDAELQALSALLTAHRLVTVVGAGGIGKSRLAQAVGHAVVDRYPQGSWMVELAGLADPTLLPNTIAGALEIQIEGPGTAAEGLIAAIAGKSMLLVLDNCEHLLEAVGELVEGIQRDASNVTVLATSQEPLRAQDEQQFRVVPLAVPPTSESGDAREFGAVALFEARVQAVDPKFSLNDETTPLAIDICRHLDGLPLAIELAAARVGTLGLRAVRDKLDARFKLLTGGLRTTLRRHQTLRAALEWSHGLLTEGERTVFRRLGVFAGGFTMELAQAVAADGQLDEWVVLDHMSALIDKSLVVADAGDSPRYRLLESARAFALEQLAAGETADVLRRHALALLSFLKRVDDANLEGELRTDQYAALVVPELDNLRAAYAWASGEDGDRPIAIALASHAGSLIDYVIECSNWLLPHLQEVRNGAVDLAIEARYWRALAAGNMSTRVPLTLCVEAAERARSMYQTLDKPRRVFSSLMRLVSYRQSQHRLPEAQTALAEARSLIRPEWPTEFHIHMLRRESSLARGEGKFADALALMRSEVRLAETTGDWRLQAIARNNLVDLLWQVGQNADAESEARRLLGELRTRPAALSDTDVLYANLFGMLSEAGRIDEASSVAREALPVMRRSRAFFLEEWIHLFWQRGQLETAALLLGALDAATKQSGLPPQSNEHRLLSQASKGVEQTMDSRALAGYRASGAALGGYRGRTEDAERLADLLSTALAQPFSAN